MVEEQAMPGPKPKYPIELFDNENAELRGLVKSRKTAHGKVVRAKIILAAYEHSEWSNQEIARYAGCSDRAVRFWRRRWVTTSSLADRPGPGAPKRFPP